MIKLAESWEEIIYQELIFSSLSSHSIFFSSLISFISFCSEGVRAMHLKGIYHRDLKPANILGFDELVDFEIC